MAKVARKILQIAKVAKKLPSNLWPRLGKIRFLDVAHFKIQMLTNLTVHSAFCFAFFQGLVMKYRLEMTNEKDAPDQCKYRLAWVKSFNHKSEQEAEATTSATATRTAKTQQVHIGKQQLCTSQFCVGRDPRQTTLFFFNLDTVFQNSTPEQFVNT